MSFLLLIKQPTAAAYNYLVSAGFFAQRINHVCMHVILCWRVHLPRDTTIVT